MLETESQTFHDCKSGDFPEQPSNRGDIYVTAIWEIVPKYGGGIA